MSGPLTCGFHEVITPFAAGTKLCGKPAVARTVGYTKTPLCVEHYERAISLGYSHPPVLLTTEQ